MTNREKIEIIKTWGNDLVRFLVLSEMKFYFKDKGVDESNKSFQENFLNDDSIDMTRAGKIFRRREVG